MMQPGPFLSAKENDDAFPPKHPAKKKLQKFPTEVSRYFRHDVS